MKYGIGIRHAKAGILFFFLVAFAALAGGGLFATDSHAYQRYADGCNSCHGTFTGSTSPKGTVFGGGNKHEMHRNSSFMGTACGLCHVTDGDNASMSTSRGSGTVAGSGCTGCHNAAGLRNHHRTTGASSCSCHGASAEAAPAESTQPPYYGTTATRANNACNPVATANLNENWSVGDFRGLDNDGDNLYDLSDPNCVSVVNNPVPTLTSLSPTSATAGGATFTLTVNGTGFVTGSVVRWNGVARTTTYVSGTQLRASIQAADIATAGIFPVTVFNPTPGGGTSTAVQFTVTAANTAPVAANDSYSVTAGTTLTVGSATGVLVNDTDAQGNPLTAVLGTGPSSGTFSLSSNGSFTYTPSIASGSVSFTYRASDGSLASNLATVTITVNAAAKTLSSIAISGASSVDESTNATYVATATWSDGSTTNVTSLATWTTNLGTISTAGQFSAPSVTANQTAIIGASYTSGTVTRTASVGVSVVDVAAPLTITTASLPAGTVGTAYSQTLAATGGTTPFIWSVSAGTLPAGLSLSAGGVLDGTPTAAGTSSFTVQVTGGGTATKAFSVTINPAPVAGGVTVMPADGAVDVPVNTVVSGTLTGTGDIASIFNAQTFTLKVKSAATATISSSSPDDRCVDDGIVKGAISYNESNTAGTFTPTCLLTNGTVYTATIASSTGGLSAAKTWEFTTIVASPDTDDDGVPDNEDDHPGNKGKGTPPSSRGHGKFLIDVTDTAGASLAVTKGMAETDASLNQAGIPSGYEFPDGLISYQVIGVAPGGTATVKITFPSGIPAGSKVYKVGPAGFQEFGGATIQGSTVTLILTDGGAGDSDGQVNGIIVDPVGVAAPVASGAGSIDLSSASGGGGCSVAGRTGSGSSNIDMAMVLAGLGLSVWGIRIRRRRE